MARKETYKDKKEWVRSQAIEYQYIMSREQWSYSTIAEMCGIFSKLGKRYGLLKEFRENGII